MIISEIIERYDTSLATIAQKSGISKAKLRTAFDHPVDTWTIQFLNNVAAAINERPDKLLRLLQDEHYSLTIDDQHQAIQGVGISDPINYQNIKFTVKSNVMEGWHPSHSDIEAVKEFTQSRHPNLEQKFKDIFED